MEKSISKKKKGTFDFLNCRKVIKRLDNRIDTYNSRHEYLLKKSNHYLGQNFIDLGNEIPKIA